MNATALYVSTCRYILQADYENSNSWADLYRLLPYLRQALSCCVCGTLLDNPQGPTNSNCQHFVCMSCVGGKMLLKPSCSWCKDYTKFAEVKQLRILLSCYKKLCEYIAATPIARSLVGANGESNNTMTILQEGMAINVIHECSAQSRDKGLHILDILTKANGDKALSKSLSQRRRQRSNGTSPKHSECENPEAMSPLPELRLGDMGYEVNGDGYLDVADDQQSFYSVSVSNSDSPKIKIKRKHSEHKSKNKKKKKKREKDKEKKMERERDKRAGSDDSRDSGQSKKKHRKHHKMSNGDLSPEPPKKQTTLIISGHRAKLLKAGKQLPPKNGCRCGTWNRHPGVNTCFGNRCPCFMEEKGCDKCKCRGCRNPYDDVKEKKKRHSLKNKVSRARSPSIRKELNGESSDLDVDITDF